MELINAVIQHCYSYFSYNTVSASSLVVHCISTLRELLPLLVKRYRDYMPIIKKYILAEETPLLTKNPIKGVL